MVKTLLCNLQIRGSLEERNKVVITGHSIGGSMASLTALWLLSDLQSISLTPFDVLCITFGSPLLGNQSLSSAISRLHLDRNFCHVVSTCDIVPRILLSPLSPEISRAISTSIQFGGQNLPQQNVTSEDGLRTRGFWLFGSYLLCSKEGGICLDNASSVSRMLLMLNTRTPTPSIEDHLKYVEYVEILSLQFLKSRGFRCEDVYESSYNTGLNVAVKSLGIHDEEPARTVARECIEMARRSGQRPNLKSAELSRNLADVVYHRLRIQWYQERCNALNEQLGYYDFFKRASTHRDREINKSRVILATFWDRVIRMIELNELPINFHLRKKWVYASNFYQLLAEPLDIAEFYKSRKREERGCHYLMQGNRPKRYEEFDKWWRELSKTHGKKYERTTNASATQDSCFWAKLEEAKEYLEDIKIERDLHKQSILWNKIVTFESYANELEKKKDVSIDVLAKNSTYTIWKELLGKYKSQLPVALSEGVEDVLMDIN